MKELPLILALDITGTPHRWIAYERAAFYYAKDLVAWQMGGEDNRIHGGIQRVTGQRSFLDLNTIIAIRGLNQAKMHRPPLTNKALFRRDQQICGYCGEHFTVGDLTRDHITPMSQGGKDIWTNVVSACKPCNAHKGGETPEDAGMQLIFVPYVPDRAEYLILMNRRILADQMEFLIKQVKNKNSRLLHS